MKKNFFKSVGVLSSVGKNKKVSVIVLSSIGLFLSVGNFFLIMPLLKIIQSMEQDCQLHGLIKSKKDELAAFFFGFIILDSCMRVS
jgi:hypothetical protein